MGGRLPENQPIAHDGTRKVKGRWKRKLKTDGALHVEIGAGKGSYSHDMARMNPEDGFIAIEKMNLRPA